MGKSPCCDKIVLKKGPWTPEEDQKLLAFIEEHGHGNWRALPSKSGLQRCGKSCRLRWTNYLRPDIKRGKFTLQEEQTIIQLHALLGNRWSAIATHLPKRTDNEIKNYWNTHLKKRLAKMGIDPVTHKSKNDALHSAHGGHQSKTNLSHMAQWESARLEAEARLVRQSKLKSASSSNNIMCENNNYSCVTAPSLELHVNDHHQIVPSSVSLGSLSCSSSTSAHHYLATMTSFGASCSIDTTNTNTDTNIAPRCLDVMKPWQSDGMWPSTCSTSATNEGFIGITMGSTEIDGGASGGGGGGSVGVGIESPTSTLSFSENNAPLGVPNMGTTTTPVIEFMSHNHHEVIHDINATTSLEERQDDDNDDGDDDKDYDDDGNHHHGHGFMEGFTELLLSNNNTTTATKNAMSCERSQQEDNKTYWNSILNLVNSSPSHSPMF